MKGRMVGAWLGIDFGVGSVHELSVMECGG